MQSDAMPINQWQYNDVLAQLCGPDVPKSAQWRRELTSLILPKAIFARPDTFRDRPTEEEALAFDRANQILRKSLTLHQTVSSGLASDATGDAAVAQLSKL